MVEHDNPFNTVTRATTIVNHLDINVGMTVVDIGCGPGRITIPLAQRVGPSGTVVAMDIQAGMLDKVKEKARTAHMNNITFLQAGIGKGKLKPNHFDRALFVSVLGEIPNRQTALKEIFNALKPGGMLSITETIFDPHFKSRNSVLKLAMETGFKEKQFFGNRLAYTLNFEKPI